MEEFLQDDIVIKTADGLTYHEYDSTVDGETFHYVSFIFKSGEGFWEIQFATDAKDAAGSFEQIKTYAKSIKFS